METVVGVRFKKAGKVYYFDPGNLEIFKTDRVILETARGVELGEVVVGPKQVSEEEVVSPLKEVIRKATPKDLEVYQENKEKEKEAFAICDKKIESHGLEMKLVDVEYTFDNNKIVFYFTAEGRVDFRELVKDLASVFRTRIELRQIGVRDEAKMIGGYGPCGISLCCSTWLGEFDPVSIKMAKDQGLSLNPTKISGVCGRLFCCLKYEHDVYKAVLKKMPQNGDRVQTPTGKGVIVSTNPLLERVKARVTNDEDGSEEIKVFQIEEITKIPKGSRGKPEEKPKASSGEKANKPAAGKKDTGGKKEPVAKKGSGEEKSEETRKKDAGGKDSSEKKSSKSRQRPKRSQSKKRPPRGSKKKNKARDGKAKETPKKPTDKA